QKYGKQARVDYGQGDQYERRMIEVPRQSQTIQKSRREPGGGKTEHGVEQHRWEENLSYVQFGREQVQGYASRTIGSQAGEPSRSLWTGWRSSPGPRIRREILRAGEMNSRSLVSRCSSGLRLPPLSRSAPPEISGSHQAARENRQNPPLRGAARD